MRKAAAKLGIPFRPELKVREQAMIENANKEIADNKAKGAISCRSCGAPIVFLKTRKDRRIPVDAGTVKLGDKDFDHTRHISHFATCPLAGRHRKRKE